MALCRITGIVYLPSGEIAARREVTFVKEPDTVTADYLGAVLPEPVRTRTDTDGSIDLTLITGNYYGFILGRGGYNKYTFRSIVPEATTADFADLIAAVDPVEPLPSWLQQVIEARDEAAASAASAEAAADMANKAPTSWADLQAEPFLNLLDGVLVYFGGVQVVRDRASVIAGLAAGDGWTPYGVVTPIHFSDFASYTNYAALAESSTIVSGVEVADAAVLSAGDGSIIAGKSPSRATISRSYPRGTLVNLEDDSNVEISGLTLDMSSSVVNEGGHAVRSVGGDYITVADMRITGFGLPVGGGAGGTGVLISSPTEGGPPTVGNRLRNLHLSGSTALTPSECFGWILSDAHYSFASEIYSENALGTVTAMAHELKNDARWNNIIQLTARNSIYGLGYGQTTTGVNGAKFNIATSILSAACDRGAVISEGQRNLVVGMIHDTTDAPGAISGATVNLNGGAERNVFIGMMSNGGSSNTGVSITESPNNYVSISMMGNVNANILNAMGAGSTRNVIDVQHPGGGSNVRARISDTSGNSRRGVNANVVYCHATGERIGSLSGTFTDVLSSTGDLGITWNAGHYWRREADTQAIDARATNGTAGNITGITHVTPENTERGSLWHQLGVTSDADFWSLRGWGVSTRYTWARDFYRPAADNAITLGTASNRWAEVFSGNGVINTSDGREKQDVSDIDDDVLDAWGDVSLVNFRWIDSVRDKGDLARIHFGLIAQQVLSAFNARGLNAQDYGILCYDEWPASDALFDEDGNETVSAVEAGNRWGIRADQCLWLEAAYQRRRLDRIEAMLKDK